MLLILKKIFSIVKGLKIRGSWDHILNIKYTRNYSRSYAEAVLAEGAGRSQLRYFGRETV